MDFFQAQTDAKRNTWKLLLLLLIAIITIVGIVTFVVAYAFFALNSSAVVSQPELNTTNQPALHTLLIDQLGHSGLAGIAFCVLGVILIGMGHKSLQLRGGGKIIALSLGGRQIAPNTEDPHERKALNIIEEMAIASGCPVPPVYLLNEDSINAFAAGKTLQDAVIGLTRGCIEQLNRSELQGVIAHEFSHILQGDMKLNTQLISLLNGIMIIGLIGRCLAPSRRFHSRRRYHSYGHHNNRFQSTVELLGFVLIIIGFIGTFFGNLIKAAVSRQREFLADASAVQFTRDPQGIAGALKKIGGVIEGSELSHPNTAQFSHLYFSAANTSRFTNFFCGWLATHPPLKDRIKRIDPRWRGRFPKVLQGNPIDIDEATSTVSALNASQAPPSRINQSKLEQASQLIGQTTPQHITLAHDDIQALPQETLIAARDLYAAKALMYGILMLSSKSSTIIKKQWQKLQQSADQKVLIETKKLLPAIKTLSRKQTFMLVEISIPTLKQLSALQYNDFKNHIMMLIKADQQVDLFEWMLFSILQTHLETGKNTPGANKTIKQLSPAIKHIFITVIALQHPGNTTDQHKILKLSLAELKLTPSALPSSSVIQRPSSDKNIRLLEQSMCHINQLTPLQKPIFLKALKHCILTNEEIDLRPQSLEAAEEAAELFRVIALRIDCPMPPLI